jgi:hypothetical protein
VGVPDKRWKTGHDAGHVCDNDTMTAVLEAVPGHCEHVQPLLLADDQLNGALTTKNWAESKGDVIVAASINVVDVS